MKILAIISGEYGDRHVRNIIEKGPSNWKIETWRAPSIFPPVIDYPEDYLPKNLPSADLVLSFAEHRGVAELLPDIAQMIGAQAVIAAIDNESWLPRGLARQLRGWLENLGIACATPKPLCSLTESDYMMTRKQRLKYFSPFITEFAEYFGQPQIELKIDPIKKIILSAVTHRDAVCGCAYHVAQSLIGLTVDEAEEKAGLFHHHYPCMASMEKDPDFGGDTLMHASGNLLKDNISAQVKPYKSQGYISPGKRSAQ